MRPRIVAQLSESIPSGTFTTRRVERRRGNTSTRRVERRRWAGREGVSATQDLRLRVRAPLKLSTSGRFVPANFPFSASSASSCSFSSLSSRCSQSCRNSADQQETANDIKQERPRMPVHVPSVVGSLTDPLACASSLYALARPPYKHAARASGIRRFGPCFAAAKPPMECGNLLPLSGLQPPANTPVRAFRSPNSDLRSPTPCVPDVRSSAFSRLAQYRPRQEPRKTRNTRKESENRTGGRRGNGDVPCNDECRKSNDERSPKSQIDASPSAPARPDLPSPNFQLRAPSFHLRASNPDLHRRARALPLPSPPPHQRVPISHLRSPSFQLRSSPEGSRPSAPISELPASNSRVSASRSPISDLRSPNSVSPPHQRVTSN